MRMMFGLVGLLVTFAIIAWIWGFVAHPADTARKGNEVRSTAAQIAGVSAQTGMPATASARFTPRESSGRVDGLIVETLVPGGPMEAHFGLMPDDVILEIGPNGKVRDIAMSGGPEMASALAYEAFQRQWQLVVLRGADRLTLPLPGVYVPPPPAGVPTGAIDRQFNLMKPIPSH